MSIYVIDAIFWCVVGLLIGVCLAWYAFYIGVKVGRADVILTALARYPTWQHWVGAGAYMYFKDLKEKLK